MSDSWKPRTLGELCDFVRGPFGGSLKKSCFKPSGYAVYEQQHAIYDQFEEIRYFVDEAKYLEMQRFKLSPGDLIMSCSGTMGKIAIVPDGIPDGIINQALLKLSPGKETLATFLRYWMSSPNFQNELSRLSQGVAIKNVASVKVLKEIQIFLPSAPEQKRIVAILDEVFAGIDDAIANTEKNITNARELFESYSSNLNAPKRALGELVDIKTGKLNANAATENGRYPFFTCSREAYRIDSFAFDCEAILLAGNNAVGNFNVKHYEGKFNAYQRTYVITVNEENNVLYRYLYFQILKSLKEFKLKSVGAGTKFLKLGMIEGLLISLPPLDEQCKIVDTLNSLEINTQRLEAIYQQKLTALNELKQSILQKAFTGELTADTATEATQAIKEEIAA